MEAMISRSLVEWRASDSLLQSSWHLPTTSAISSGAAQQSWRWWA